MRKGWVKAVMAVFCVLLLNIGVWGCVLSGLYYGNLAWEENFYETTLCRRVTEENLELVGKKIQLWNNKGEGNLSVYAQQQMDELDEKLAPEHTNFRYRCTERYSSVGTVVFSNVEGDNWGESVYEVLITHRYDRYVIEHGVTAPMAVEDKYTQAQGQMEWLEQWMPVILGGTIALIVVGLIPLILLMRVVGRRPGREEVVLNWHDKIPYDLYLATQAGLIILGIASVLESVWYIEQYLHWVNVLWMVGSGVACSIFGVALLLTTVTRIKARTIFHNTIIWRLCKLIWRVVKKLWNSAGKAIHALPLIWRVVVIFLIYVIGSAVFFLVKPLWFIWQVLALFFVCCWAIQWRKIREVAGEIVAGKTDVKIDTKKFYPDLKQHAEQMNDLGGAIDNAVNERMKSERFKSELITNVSHDLKTPLTSIINYVDLLKKEEIENPTAQEYIEVLDRKSQRLKKLTEDLVEASKASTGALAVNKDDLDLVQLIRQALGEYEEKLTNAGLSLVTNLPESEIRVRADGRHVWRVLDNLLNNCVKYALEGTRVYLDAAAWNGNAVITVKNISRNPLNVPAEQLVERFVRGDESRTTEGSGLGLSIARSLTELQGGQFGLDIDGDLFKAKVTLPLMGE